MKDRIASFLTDLDTALDAKFKDEVLKIYHVGRSALVWAYDSPSATKDIDMLRPDNDSPLFQEALKLAGQGSSIAQRHGIYLEVVPPGLPPVPRGYRARSTRVDGPWQVLEVYRLDPNDLAATKLKRFSARDREDIQFLCDLDLINRVQLRTSLDEAFYWVTEDIGDRDRDGAYKSLQKVIDYLDGNIDEL
jgi:hypothetical protein